MSGIIVEDASSPAAVSGAGATRTTASFSPPIGTLLVAVASWGWTTAAAMTAAFSDSGSHTWTTGVIFNNASFPECVAIGYTYLASAPGSITVTATGTGSGSAASSLAVKAIAGAAPTQTGASASAHATNTCSLAITPTRTGSHIYGAVSDGGTNAAMTVLGNTTQLSQQNDASTGTTEATFRSTSPTTGVGSTTYGFSTIATGDGIVVALLEIIPALTASLAAIGC